ncbi:MAG TPA: DUF805 domain-containing protein [Thermoanaerobaculia bacterium]|jgi:uncharacterized membrane protein YhaH (DUF805 family)|nr:DUF805 domain-containing protein [Thermoanaerobaculia bacterium]
MWYFKALGRYAGFSGRADRTEFWSFTVPNALAIGALEGLLDLRTHPLSGLFSLLILIPTVAVAVRRLHDTGRSGWHLLLSFVPCLGYLVLLFFWLEAGDIGDNEYGWSPAVAERPILSLTDHLPWEPASPAGSQVDVYGRSPAAAKQPTLTLTGRLPWEPQSPRGS